MTIFTVLIGISVLELHIKLHLCLLGIVGVGRDRLGYMGRKLTRAKFEGTIVALSWLD